MGAGAHHEQGHRDEEVLGPSDRSFGFTFAVVFGLLAGIARWRGSGASVWLALAAALFLLATLTWPRVLHPLNRLWLRIGLVLHRIVTPVVMGLIFLLVVTPTGLLMRLFGAGGVSRRPDPARVSYWHERAPQEPLATTMRRQF